MASTILPMDAPDKTPNEGLVHLSIVWEPDEPPTPRPVEEEPLLPPVATGPEPRPYLTFAFVVGVPTTLAVLARSADYTVFATVFAGVFPIVCIAAYLITPLAPAEDDPTEPPPPKIDDYVPPSIASLFTGVTRAVDSVKGATVGSIMAFVGPVVGPHMLLIAQCLQLSMGVSAIMEVGVGFKEIHTIGAAIITLIITLIAVPDSFGWAIKEGTPTGDAYNQLVNKFNNAKEKIEASVSLSANTVVTSMQERQEALQEQMAEVYKALPCVASEDVKGGGGAAGKGPLRPFVIIFLRWFDEVGSLVRASPLKVLIMVLDLTIAVNDFALPNFHGMAMSVYHFAFPLPPTPMLWAFAAQSPAFAGRIDECNDGGSRWLDPGARGDEDACRIVDEASQLFLSRRITARNARTPATAAFQGQNKLTL
ncbi:MAG: hypothetical protein ACPIOQ_45610 [Promethearchaeia archaeon]